ncbi:MAG: putative transporter, partial [Aeromicrobium sp.]|nr:putative transporter [Aeromicrobium sp.]
VGVAVMSVILTNHFKDSKAVSAGNALAEAKQSGDPAPQSVVDYVQSLGGRFESLVQSDMASAFASTFLVAWALVILTIVPAYFLPRKSETVDLEDGTAKAPVILH